MHLAMIYRSKSLVQEMYAPPSPTEPRQQRAAVLHGALSPTAACHAVPTAAPRVPRGWTRAARARLSIRTTIGPHWKSA